MTEQARCQLCGEPMPAGEEMFKYHGYSGDCPKPPQQKPQETSTAMAIRLIREDERERCAKIAEEVSRSEAGYAAGVAYRIATLIRDAALVTQDEAK